MSGPSADGGVKSKESMTSKFSQAACNVTTATTDSYTPPGCFDKDTDDETLLAACGYPGEWTPNGTADCTLANGSGGIVPICRRKAYLGDPLSCCLQNYAGTPSNTQVFACFSSTDDKGNVDLSTAGPYPTCSNDFDTVTGNDGTRNLISSSCENALISYCLGYDPTPAASSNAPPGYQNQVPDSVFKARWTQSLPGVPSCPEIIATKLFRQDAGPVITIGDTGIDGIDYDYVRSGFYWSSDLVRRAVQRFTAKTVYDSYPGTNSLAPSLSYTGMGKSLGRKPGDLDYDIWEDTLFDKVCQPFPGVCDSALAVACEDVTIDVASRVKRIGRWCGCHMPAEQYEQYSRDYGITPECTPVCNRGGTLPSATIGGNINRCTSRVCVIDGVSLNVQDSAIGDIDINQVCSGCSAGGCTCIVADQTIDIERSLVGGAVTAVDQACSSYSCTKNGVQTTCNDEPLTRQAATGSAASHRWTYIIIAILVIIMIVGLIILFVI